jgi:hypothetical protein
VILGKRFESKRLDEGHLGCMNLWRFRCLELKLEEDEYRSCDERRRHCELTGIRRLINGHEYLSPIIPRIRSEIINLFFLSHHQSTINLNNSSATAFHKLACTYKSPSIGNIGHRRMSLVERQESLSTQIRKTVNQLHFYAFSLPIEDDSQRTVIPDDNRTSLRLVERTNLSCLDNPL